MLATIKQNGTSRLPNSEIERFLGHARLRKIIEGQFIFFLLYSKSIDRIEKKNIYVIRFYLLSQCINSIEKKIKSNIKLEISELEPKNKK